MSKVVVCGAAGGIGQPLSLLLKTSLPRGSTLALYDVANVKGVAADLSHINTGVKVTHHTGDAEKENALDGADVVLIPAGVPRKPGMTRDDLFNTNAGIVKNLIEGIAKKCPKAFIGIITNPVNSTVPIAAEVLKKAGVYDAKRLFGVSTLDVVRAQAFVGDLKNQDPSKLDIDVVGGHSPETMIPILSAIKGATFSKEEATDLTKRVKNAGTAVVEAKGAGSATLSMAYAAARFADNLIKARHGQTVREIAFVDVKSLKGEAPTSYFGVAVDVNKDGITKVHPLPKMNEYEQSQMPEAVKALEGNIKTGENFVNKA